MSSADEPKASSAPSPSTAPKPPSSQTEVGERARAFDDLFRRTALPETIGRYVILDTLGAGGMGTVLRAFDRELDRPIALKVLHDDLDEKHSARLHREAQAMAKLSHPNVVQVYEVGQVQGRTFVAMELVKGSSADQWIRQQPRPDWRDSTEVFIQLGEGLAAAHAKGLVHRDFKPGNAIIDQEGRARVLDFGLARRVTAEGADEPASVALPAGTKHLGPGALETPLTRTGAILGTPAYMPLEQMTGHETDPRSDQFSFCVSLYEAVYGERPFEGRSLYELAAAIGASELRPAPRDTDVPDTLRTALVRGLAAARAERWPSMKALLEQLQRVVLEHAKPAEALPLFERALSLCTTQQVDPALLATTRFVLARTLWAGPTPSDRAHAHSASDDAEQDESYEARPASRAATRWQEVFGEADSWLSNYGMEDLGLRRPDQRIEARDSSSSEPPAEPPQRLIRRPVDLTEHADDLLHALRRRTGAISFSEVICRALATYALVIEAQGEDEGS